jgi:oligoribonuclease NrnB/cAMP/cGMP phosphodiesterase (DHH superfamily)
MKITKTKLKQIIKEEIDKILDEGFLDSLTNMFGKTSGSGSAILDKAIKESKFDDFEELKKIIHIRYRDQNPDGKIQDLVKTAKELDASTIPGSSREKALRQVLVHFLSQMNPRNSFYTRGFLKPFRIDYNQFENSY